MHYKERVKKKVLHGEFQPPIEGEFTRNINQKMAPSTDVRKATLVDYARAWMKRTLHK